MRRISSGTSKARLALYPIALQTATPGTNLLNWAVAARLGAGAGRPPRREDWNRLGRPDELVPQIDGAFELSVIDPVEIVRTTREFFEFPMCDRDPVPRWSFGRVTLLGDAAHPMYPFGSNGAGQAILDARSVAPLLAGTKNVAAALRAYEATRLPATTRIVNDNRCGGRQPRRARGDREGLREDGGLRPGPGKPLKERSIAWVYQTQRSSRVAIPPRAP